MISQSVARFILFIQIVSTLALVLSLAYLFAIWWDPPWSRVTGGAAFQSIVFSHLVPIMTLLIGLMGFCAARLLQWFEFDPTPLTTIRPSDSGPSPVPAGDPARRRERRQAPGWFKGFS